MCDTSGCPQPTDTRHLVVHQHHGRIVFATQRNGFLTTAGGGNNAIARLRLQHLFNAESHKVVIVSQQNTDH